jgi:hypothetical protein
MIDMGAMTLGQAIEGHRLLWNWLAETRSWDKITWPGWENYVRRAETYCFACELALGPELETDCTRCPVKWPGGHCISLESPYHAWQNDADPERRRELALIIRDLPWKEVNQ